MCVIGRRLLRWWSSNINLFEYNKFWPIPRYVYEWPDHLGSSLYFSELPYLSRAEVFIYILAAGHICSSGTLSSVPQPDRRSHRNPCITQGIQKRGKNKYRQTYLDKATTTLRSSEASPQPTFRGIVLESRIHS